MMGFKDIGDRGLAPLPPHGFWSYLRLLVRHVQNDWRRYRSCRSKRCPECDSELVAQSQSPIHPGRGCPAGHVFYARRFVRPRVESVTVEELLLAYGQPVDPPETE